MFKCFIQGVNVKSSLIKNIFYSSAGRSCKVFQVLLRHFLRLPAPGILPSGEIARSKWTKTSNMKWVWIEMSLNCFSKSIGENFILNFQQSSWPYKPQNWSEPSRGDWQIQQIMIIMVVNVQVLSKSCQKWPTFLVWYIVYRHYFTCWILRPPY